MGPGQGIHRFHLATETIRRCNLLTICGEEKINKGKRSAVLRSQGLLIRHAELSSESVHISLVSVMFAALVKTAVEEIAWEGPPGISWSQLLSTLQQNGDLAIDAPIRSGLWRELAKQDIIVRGAKGAAHRTGRALPAATAGMTATEPSDADSGKVLLDIPNELRSHVLLLDAHPDIAENDLSRRALQLVAKSRAKGTSGASLASQLGVNCRDLFYVLEGLRTAGLLVGVLPLAQKDLAVSKESSEPESTWQSFPFLEIFRHGECRERPDTGIYPKFIFQTSKPNFIGAAAAFLECLF